MAKDTIDLGSEVVRRAIWDSLRKLHPRTMAKNPVMFVVEVGSVLTTMRLVLDLVAGRAGLRLRIPDHPLAVVHGAVRQLRRGDGGRTRQGAGRHSAQSQDRNHGQPRCGRRHARPCPRASLRKDDVVIVSAGEFIPVTARLSKAWHRSMSRRLPANPHRSSASPAATVRRSPAAHACCRTGSRSRITSNPGDTFLDRMIALVEGAERQKTPNEIALNILLAGLTIIFLLAVVTLQPFADLFRTRRRSIFVLVSLLVCLIPTTIGGLLSAIGIAGMDRLVQHNVLAMSGRAVEAAGDVNTLLLDKTGTITLGNRQATEFVALPGVDGADLADAAHSSRWPTKRPKAGRSSSWRRRSTVCAGASWARQEARCSSRSPRKRACPALTSTAAKFAKVPRTRSRVCVRHGRRSCRTSCRRLSNASHATAVRRWSSRTTRARSE